MLDDFVFAEVDLCSFQLALIETNIDYHRMAFEETLLKDVGCAVEGICFCHSNLELLGRNAAVGGLIEIASIYFLN